MPAKPPRGEPEPNTTVTVVRYPNRRLYDRTHNTYVTLPDIERMVRQGQNVTVRDSRTDEDLTRTVLTQIILEHYPERMDTLPVPFLHSMIRSNDVALDYLRQYLQQSLAFLDSLQQGGGVNPLASPLGWMRMFLPPAPVPAPGPPAASTAPDADALARRLEELERRLAELAAVAGTPPHGESPARGKRTAE